MNIKEFAKIILFIMIILVLSYASIIYGEQTYTFNGSLIEPSIQAYKFSLTQSNGKIFALDDYRGDVFLLFFGYTFCPDVCPTTLVDYKRMIIELEEQAENVHFIMISVDPDRDTPDIVNEFTTSFHPSIIGLSGTEDELSSIWENYFVTRSLETEEENYLVEHSARIFVVDKQGNLRMTFPLGMSIDTMLEDIEYLLKE